MKGEQTDKWIEYACNVRYTARKSRRKTLEPIVLKMTSMFTILDMLLEKVEESFFKSCNNRWAYNFKNYVSSWLRS